MYSPALAFTSLTLLTLASSAPVATTLSTRGDTCTITGYEGDSQSVSYGIGATGTSASGGLSVSCTSGQKWSNGDQLPNPQTVKASDTKLAQDINWDQSWKTGGYVSCSASYGGGGKVDGTTGNNIQPGVGVTSSSSTCVVTFDI